MKFIINIPKMEHKGDCGHCPMLSFNYYDNDYHCELLDCAMKERDMEEYCPLEESHDVP